MNTRPNIVKNDKPEVIDNYIVSKKHVEIGELQLPILDIEKIAGKNYVPVSYPDRPGRVMGLKSAKNRAPHLYCVDINADTDDSRQWRLVGIIQNILVYKFKFYQDAITVIGAEYPELYSTPGFIAVFRTEQKSSRVLYKGFWGNMDIEKEMDISEKFIIDGTDFTAYRSSFICCGTLDRFADEYRINRKSVIITTEDADNSQFGTAQTFFGKNMASENVVKIIKIRNPESAKSVDAAIDEMIDYRSLITNPLTTYILGFNDEITRKIRAAVTEVEKNVFSHMDYPHDAFTLFSKDVLPKKKDKPQQDDEEVSNDDTDIKAAEDLNVAEAADIDEDVKVAEALNVAD